MQGGLFERIAATGAIVDDIIQTEAGETANVSFMVDRSDLPDVKVAMERVLKDAGTGDMSIETGLAKISAVGVGMRTHAGVAATMFKALGEAGIHIANISTSEIKISCIVPEDQGKHALRVVHDAFELGNTPESSAIGVRAGTH
jgi:aspartate kinase